MSESTRPRLPAILITIEDFNANEASPRPTPQQPHSAEHLTVPEPSRTNEADSFRLNSPRPTAVAAPDPEVDSIPLNRLTLQPSESDSPGQGQEQRPGVEILLEHIFTIDSEHLPQTLEGFPDELVEMLLRTELGEEHWPIVIRAGAAAATGEMDADREEMNLESLVGLLNGIMGRGHEVWTVREGVEGVAEEGVVEKNEEGGLE